MMSKTLTVILTSSFIILVGFSRFTPVRSSRVKVNLMKQIDELISKGNPRIKPTPKGKPIKPNPEINQNEISPMNTVIVPKGNTKIRPRTTFDKIIELYSCNREPPCPAILDPVCALNDRNELEVFANECKLLRHKLVRPLNSYYVLNKDCCMVIFQYCHAPDMNLYGTPYS